MAKKRSARSASFKAKIAIEALRERRTVGDLAKHHSVHPTHIHQWRKQLLDRADELYQDGRSKRVRDDTEVSNEELYEQIGRLKMENEWLKKRAAEFH